jgi:hypothetical protein
MKQRGKVGTHEHSRKMKAVEENRDPKVIPTKMDCKTFRTGKQSKEQQNRVQ